MEQLKAVRAMIDESRHATYETLRHGRRRDKTSADQPTDRTFVRKITEKLM